MEIIHLILGKANPDRLNGVNKVIYNLAKYQCLTGRNVKVWGITSNLLHDYPERVFETKLFKAETFPFRINKELKKEILKHKEAVYHLHGGWIPVYASLSKFFHKNQIRYVLTPHGSYNEIAMCKNALRKKIYYQMFEHTLVQNATCIHSLGHSEIVGLKRIHPQAKSCLIPYGLEWNSNPTLQVKNHKFTVGFAGRLDIHTKGLDLLIEAFARFQRKQPGAALWIIGDGRDRKILEKEVIRKEIKHVVFWGSKFGKEKDDLISKMHVFAHPSRNEGLPTAVLESATLGTPSVITQATNLADYVSDYQAGISVENENKQALYEALMTLHQAYQKEEAQGYREGALKMIQEVFSWNTLVEKYDQLYKHN